MPTQRRYARIAVVLHWLIALAIIANIIGGLTLDWFLDNADPAMKAQGLVNIALHKSLGLTIILLTVVRLAWRLANPPPALPAHMTRLERRLARSSHAAFYLLMFALPLSGWALASTGRAPIRWFGALDVPHLPVAASQRGLLGEGHELLGWTMVALLALHILAALKHQIFDRDEVMASMVPFVRARRADRA